MFINNTRFRRYYYGNIPTRYFVSEQGTIWSEMNGYIKPATTLKGYQKVGLFIYIKGKHVQKSITVHKIVAWTYLKHQWKKGYDVDHLDGNKTNNNVNNLEWVSRKTNIRRAYITGLKQPKFGDNNKITKYSDDQVREAFRLVINGSIPADAASNTGIPLGLFYMMLRGETRTRVYREFKNDLEESINNPNADKLSLPDKIMVLDLYNRNRSPSEIMSIMKLDRSCMRAVYNLVARHGHTKFEDIIIDKRETNSTTIKEWIDFENQHTIE